MLLSVTHFAFHGRKIHFKNSLYIRSQKSLLNENMYEPRTYFRNIMVSVDTELLEIKDFHPTGTSTHNHAIEKSHLLVKGNKPYADKH